MAEHTVALLQFVGWNKRLHGHFFFPVGFFTCTFCFCIFFCRLGNVVAGFLGPCRSFFVMVAVLLLPILPATAQRR